LGLRLHQEPHKNAVVFFVTTKINGKLFSGAKEKIITKIGMAN